MSDAMRKIAVYAIAKDEAKHIYRWYDSVKTADAVFVLDTGSTDSTVSKLEKCRNVNVEQQTFEPFRFDVARNTALAMVPADHFALFVDLDDVLEPDWYSKLQLLLETHPKATAVEFRHNYAHDASGTPTQTYNRLCAHLPRNYVWKYPVHELLMPVDLERELVVQSDIVVTHKPDLDKERNYLPLLELGVSLYDDARSHRYLGRELQSLSRAEEAIPYFVRAIELEESVYISSEIYASLGECYEYLGNDTDAEQAFVYGAWSAPDIRESWAQLASYCHGNRQFQQAISAATQMLYVSQPPTHSIIRNDVYYSWWPYHMLAVCYYELGMQTLAERYIDEAFNLNQNNMAIIKDLILIRNISISQSSSKTGE